jgi:CopG family transcriptional regulator, nickel-responsive regulator
MRESTQFNVCIDEPLLKRFDRLIEQKRYLNRSEATRSLIRDSLITSKPANVAEDDREVIGTVIFLYNRLGRTVSKKLSGYKKAHGDRIISYLHLHLDEKKTLEVLVVRGEKQAVSRIADELVRIKGIIECNLVMTPEGVN